MNIEIERRWLLRGKEDFFALLDAAHITQGYLTRPGLSPVVRVRLIADLDGESNLAGLQTVKADADIGCKEIEFSVPVIKTREMMSVALARLTKNRYEKPHTNGQTIEIDEFLGRLEGVFIAEIELDYPGQPVDVPDWFGPEITGNKKLSNLAMAFGNPEEILAIVRELLSEEPVAS